MQTVIDIDDNLYTRLFDNGVDNYDDAVDIAKAIRKGIPLPKGHGKLFDENKIKEEAIKCEWSRLTYDMLDHMLSYMKPIIKADKENE